MQTNGHHILNEKKISLNGKEYEKYLKYEELIQQNDATVVFTMSHDEIEAEIKLHIEKYAKRIKEAEKLGFEQIIIPSGQKYNTSGLKIKVVEVSRVVDAFRILIQK